MLELRNFEENLEKMKAGNRDSGLIPPDTRVECSLIGDLSRQSLEAVVTSSPGTVVRGAMLFAEGIFSGESCVRWLSPSLSPFFPLDFCLLFFLFQ